MNGFQRIPAVFAFEWRRALTVPRLTWLLLLTAFPPVLLTIIRSTAPNLPPVEVAATLIFILSPCVACMMSVFLWSTPAISSELEGRSWVYLSVRPYGPLAVLLGKYLVSVSWALPVGLISATISSLVLIPDDPWPVIKVQCGLVCLSCVAYSALFLLIGVLVPKRAMVAGLIYAVLFEVGAASIPAAVNLLTVQYRLRCLFVRGLGIDTRLAERDQVFQVYFGDQSTSWHVAMLLALTLLYLVAAALLLRYREFTSAAEAD